MINLSFKEIGAALAGEEGEAVTLSSQYPTEIYFDSRRIKDGRDAIFIAIKTDTQDGHDYLSDAYKKGIRAFIVSNTDASDMPKDVVVWNTPDTMDALQELAKLSRKKFSGLMVGITGSNGKTIVKEWMYQLLAGSMNIWRSPRSYNSQLGVAISLLKMDLHASVVFVETGISRPGEMKKLCDMVQPQMAVFTHFGDAHNDGFADETEKLQEKALLFNDVDVAIFSDSLPSEILNRHRNNNPLMKVITWSFQSKASYVVQSQRARKEGLELTILHKTQTFKFNIPFRDKASVANAMTCLCCLAALEQLGPKSLDKFSLLQNVENRLDSTQGKRNNLIINDSYSNDLSAFEIAVDYASAQSTRDLKVLIFSDFDIKPELVSHNIDVLQKILNKHKFAKIIAIGPWLNENRFRLDRNIHFFETKKQLLEDDILESIEDSIILIKGARKFALEDVSKLLEKEVHQTELRINLTAIKNNVKYYQSLLKGKTKLLGMVKALGYGTGGHEIAMTLQNVGVQYLGVAFASEAVEIRKNGIKLPIMVLNTRAEDILAYQHLNLEPVIYSFEQLESFKRYFRFKDLSIHIELDSGMHRLGFAINDAKQIADGIPGNFKIKTIFSHLASSEMAKDDEFTKEQTQLLQKFAGELTNYLNYEPLLHIANSAGIQRHAFAHLDMVRLGIGMYGIPAEDEPLQTAIHLVTQITQIKEVPAGDGIGYGRKDPSNATRKIGILPIGYADGLMRTLNSPESQGEVYFKGHSVSIVGNICMDMCMVDLTKVEANVGDEVEIFGSHIPVQEVAEKCNTISYEILSRISSRVKRVYTEE